MEESFDPRLRLEYESLPDHCVGELTRVTRVGSEATRLTSPINFRLKIPSGGIESGPLGPAKGREISFLERKREITASSLSLLEVSQNYV